MPVKVGNDVHDAMKEATERLDISRNTLLTYIKNELVSTPPTVRRGRTNYRYFTDAWYDENLPKVKNLGGQK